MLGITDRAGTPVDKHRCTQIFLVNPICFDFNSELACGSHVFCMRPFAFGEPALPTHSCGVRFAHTLSKTRGLIAAPSRSPLGYLPHDDGGGRVQLRYSRGRR